MEAVLISISPRWVEKILSGEKTVEVRKSRPKIEVPFKCYIYCTSIKTMNLNEYVQIYRSTGGAIDDWHGKVVAEFTCDDVKPIFPSDYTCLNDISFKSCLTNQQIAEYSDFKRIYGWHISDLVIYDNPKELSEFSLKRPPQSWQYVCNIGGAT